MDTWFGPRSDYPFELFSVSHLAVLGIAFLGFLCLVLLKDNLSTKDALFQQLRWLLFAALLISEVSYQYWAISHDYWSFNRYMPLHLCGVASITAMLGLVTLHPFWIRVSFFIGIVPAALALVTPDMPYDYQHYRFWKFFVHHTAIAWACLFLALAKPSALTWRSVFSVYGLLLLYAACIGFGVNPQMGSNYLYLSQRPSTVSSLDFFGEGIWYYVNLCLAALALFAVQYGIFRALFKKVPNEKS
ncbi:ABC transporter permease [Planococcus plakortidis]|uniref:ABC transporter permease n=1 Tax=Planococcus plakortidis TaxID=1038856 RepID=A0A1C7E7E1_9BACL|nr:TIGR02206 family membrane protein [Planococcus plakortidis]ANU19377.1 ABC transporter permease [Planococcus plakortidis]